MSGQLHTAATYFRYPLNRRLGVHHTVNILLLPRNRTLDCPAHSTIPILTTQSQLQRQKKINGQASAATKTVQKTQALNNLD